MSSTTTITATIDSQNPQILRWSYTVPDGYVGTGGSIIVRWKDPVEGEGISNIVFEDIACPGYIESWITPYCGPNTQGHCDYSTPSTAEYIQVIDNGYVQLESKRETQIKIEGLPGGDKTLNVDRGVEIDGTVYCAGEEFDEEYSYDCTSKFSCSDSYSWPGLSIGIGYGVIYVHVVPEELGDETIYTAGPFYDAYEVITIEGHAGTTPEPSTYCGNRTNAYTNGTSVTIRPVDVPTCEEFDHWEINRGSGGSGWYYEYGQSVTITARKFESCDRPYHTSVKAITRPKKFNVVISCSPENAGDAFFENSSDSEREVNCGSQVTIQATPECCYWLDYWSINGDVSLCIKPRVDIYSNTNIVAHFTKKKFKTVGDYLVYGESGNLIYGCGGNPIYGESVEDVSEKPQLVDC